MYRKQQMDVISRADLTCGKGVIECQNLANLCLSSFAESNQVQQKNFDVSPYQLGKRSVSDFIQQNTNLYAP